MLVTLSERFDTVTIAIEHTENLSSLSLIELTGALLAYKQRQAERLESSIEGAFIAKHKQQYLRKSVEKKQYDGKKRREGSRSKQQGNSKESRDTYPPFGVYNKTNHSKKN